MAKQVTSDHGIRTDDAALRWAGIGFLVAAMVLKFFGSKEKKE